MIIVDTSIWIEFFKSREPYASPVEDLAQKWVLYSPQCVFGELLQGAKTKREREFLLEYWEFLPKLEEDPHNLDIEAGILSSERKLFSKGVGLIDAKLIFMTEKTGMKLWTLDKKLLNVLPKEKRYTLSKSY